LPGGLSEWEPPDPIPNSEVKLLSADDSVGFPHVKVGHCQAFNRNPRHQMPGVFYFLFLYLIFLDNDVMAPSSFMHVAGCYAGLGLFQASLGIVSDKPAEATAMAL
jgi:hypothetical protein